MNSASAHRVVIVGRGATGVELAGHHRSRQRDLAGRLMHELRPATFIAISRRELPLRPSR